MPKKPPRRRGSRPAGKRPRKGPRRTLAARLLRALRIAVLAWLAGTAALVLLLRFVPPPATPLMVLRAASEWRGGWRPHIERHWRPLGKISPDLARAVIASEDQKFFQHHGFDFEAIASAFRRNRRGGHVLGASTITQQTAKNLFLWPDRTWLRKALEAYFTACLELAWSKRRILEVYLNIIETGDGCYGAEAGARRWFGVPAAEVRGAQAAALAAILPNPRHWSPVRPNAYVRARRDWILGQMAQLPPFPWEDGARR